jgi:hypothetical protein
MSDNLADELVKQIKRNQELLERYAEISKLPNVNTSFATYAIKQDLEFAANASVNGDVAKMIQAYNRLKDNE